MKLTRKRIALGVGAVVLSTGMAACGHRYLNAGPEERAAWIADKVAQELALDETQSGKLNLLKEELLGAARDLPERHAKLHSQALALLEQPTLDRAQVLEIVSEHTRTVNEKAPVIVAALGDFYDSLTPAQQRQVLEEIKDHMEKDRSEHAGRFWSRH